MVLVLAFAGFGIWSYTNYTSLKTDFDAEVAKGVKAEEATTRAALELELKEKEKLPLRTYQAPAALGSVRIEYPKIWSVYADESSGGGTDLDAYFHPGFVRDIRSDNRNALRVQLQDKLYSRVLDSYERDIEDGALKTTTVRSGGENGVRLDGEIDNDIIGSIVIFPVRDKTLLIWTESNEFLNDFNNNILPNISFVR